MLLFRFTGAFFDVDDCDDEPDRAPVPFERKYGDVEGFMTGTDVCFETAREREVGVGRRPVDGGRRSEAGRFAFSGLPRHSLPWV